MDGVLADTERLHWAAYRSVLLEHGVDVGLEEYRRHFIAADGGPEYACRTYALPISADELRARKAPRYLALLREGVAPFPARVPPSSACAARSGSRSRPTRRASKPT